MKKITRAELRGKHLDNDCHKAKTTTNEFGKSDNRVFCHGLYIENTDKIIDKCMECKAYIKFAQPL